MSNADPCHFRWQITNPFVPWRKLETILYTGSTASRQWNVILDPGSRSENAYTYLFFLKYVPDDERPLLYAQNVVVKIDLNGKNTQTEKGPYLFHAAERHTYSFETTFKTRPRTQRHQLDIDVEIVFRSFYIEPRPESGLIGNYEDLSDLSESLRALFDSRVLSDMLLQSANPVDIIRVHYFILAARWGSFLAERRLTAPPAVAVQTNISRPVLEYILHYMYSGAFDDNLMDFEDLASRSELFQVMDQYNIYHLYQVFVRTDSRQVRKILRNLTVSKHLLPLDDDTNGQLLNDPSFPLLIGENDLYRVEFRIQFFLSGDVPSYSYSMHLTEGFTCYLEVALEFVKEDSTRTSREIFPEHQHEYTIDSAVPVESRTIAFKNDLPLNNSPSQMVVKDRYSILCTLRASDETESVSVESSGDEEPQNNLDELNTLSNHMYELMRNGIQTDFEVRCFDDIREIMHSHRLHRAVLEVRVPAWRRVLTNLEGIPHSPVKESFVRSEGFEQVLEYMYTGKTLAIPLRFLEEVDQFAINGRFGSLSRLVLGLRQANRN